MRDSQDGKKCYSPQWHSLYYRHYTNGEGNEPIDKCLKCKYCEWHDEWKKEAKKG